MAIGNLLWFGAPPGWGDGDSGPRGRDGGCTPILFRLGEKECAVHGGRKSRLVPKSCLAAGLGKDGGFSKKAPDICCLVYALGAGTRFAETSSGQPATKRWNSSGVRIELVSAPLLLSRPAGLAVFTLALRASLRSVAPSIPLRLLPSPVFHWFLLPLPLRWILWERSGSGERGGYQFDSYPWCVPAYRRGLTT